MSFASTAFLALNPLVIDFLSVARGYGLGLGLWMFALLHLLRYLREGRQPAHLYWAAAGTGLSMAANLVFVFPCLATMASLLFAAKMIPWQAPVAKKKKQRLKPPAPVVMPVVLRYCLPSFAIAWIVVSGPVSTATAENFYAGASSLLEAGYSLTEPSYGAPIRAAAVATWLVLLAAGAAVAWRSRDSALLLIGAIAAPLAGLLALTRLTFGLPYPEGRTGIYLIPLTGLVAALLCQRAKARSLSSIAILLFLGASALRFATLFPAGPYRTWAYDASTRDAVAAMAKDHSAHPRPSVRVGATWQLEPALNFYRQVYRYEWMAPVTRASPAGSYDYYYLLGNDRAIAEKSGLRKLFSDPKAQTVLAGSAGGL